MSEQFSAKQRMLNAYRGIQSDRHVVAPEFWYYYPAKLLNVDMITFQREVPFHQALRKTFEYFDCDGWGTVGVTAENPNVEITVSDRKIDEEHWEVTTKYDTRFGSLQAKEMFSRTEPSWHTESLIKDPRNDLAAWEEITFGGNPDLLNFSEINQAVAESGGSLLLEAWLCLPFFDTYASGRDGGFEAAVMDFYDSDFVVTLERIREKYLDYTRRLVQSLSKNTTLDSFCIGCSWSCNSLIGPDMWRQWDQNALKAIAREIRLQGKVSHMHFHGRSMETAMDFADLGVDCICPFERPPGGDVAGIEGLKKLRALLGGNVTMNGNVQTVETLIRGTAQQVREEVRQILEAFGNTPRLIVGSGDQVGKETPEENLFAMIDEVKQYQK